MHLKRGIVSIPRAQSLCFLPRAIGREPHKQAWETVSNPLMQNWLLFTKHR